jgi:phospholipid/cholesterol/gamma-HCH transport system substrate-binding protein
MSDAPTRTPRRPQRRATGPAGSNGRLSRGATGGRFVPLGRIIIVLEGLVALGIVVFLFASQDVRTPFAPGRYTVNAVLPDAGGLEAEDEPVVTVAGVPVGTVTEVRTDGRRALATLALDSELRDRMRSDATAEVVPRSALNDLTLDVDPGTADEPLPETAAIRPAALSAPVGLDQVLRVLDVDTRAQLQVLLGELAVGLDGRSSDLRSALRRLAVTVESTGDVTVALDDRRRLLTKLVGELDTVFAELAEREDELGRAISGAHGTLDAVASQDQAVAESVRRLPPTLASVDAALGEVEALADPLNPALQRLRPFAHALPGALRSLRRFVPAGRDLVGALDPLVRDGRAPVADLRAVVTRLGPTASGLRAPVADLFPIVKAVDRNREGIGRLGDNFSGVFSTNDANGPILRGLGFFEDFRPENFGAPGASGAKLARLKRDAVTALVRVCRRENEVACLARYLIPGLPGSVRSGRLAIGDAGDSALRSLGELARLGTGDGR